MHCRLVELFFVITNFLKCLIIVVVHDESVLCLSDDRLTVSIVPSSRKKESRSVMYFYAESDVIRMYVSTKTKYFSRLPSGHRARDNFIRRVRVAKFHSDAILNSLVGK